MTQTLMNEQEMPDQMELNDQEIMKLNERQLRVALLAVSHGLRIEDAIELGKTYP